MRPFVLILVTALTAHAQQGELLVRVTDEGDGGGLPGANISVVGTALGAVTDAAGTAMIRGVPAGKHDLIVSLVGHTRMTVRGVEVVGGRRTNVSVVLPTMAIQTEPVVVTANRREQSLQEVPASVSVMDAASLDSRSIVTLDEALRYVPGVNITESQVNIRGSSGYSRGAGSRVMMLVDGMPILAGDAGDISFDIVPIDEIERIEVVKGAHSALYGSGALGGVVNVITKDIPAAATTRVRMYGGLSGPPSYDSWDWSGGTRSLYGVSVSHSQSFGNLGVRAYLSRSGNEGYRRNDARSRFNGALNLAYGLTPFSKATFTLDYFDHPHDNFLYWKDLDQALEPPEDQLGQELYSSKLFMGTTYTHVSSPSLTSVGRLSWYRNRFTDNISTPGNRALSDVLRAELQMTWAPAESHILTGGIEGSLDIVASNLFGDREGWGAAAYLQDEIRLSDPLRLTVGVRFDVADVDSLETRSRVNPKIALTYAPAPGTTIRLAAGTGFRNPTVAEAFTSTTAGGITIAPNPALLPERSISAEVGFKQILGELAVIDAALFTSSYEDLIEVGADTSAGLQGKFSNVTEARVQGFEISSTVALLQRMLFVDVGYTYVYPLDLTTDDILKYRPRHILMTSVSFRAAPFAAGVDYRYLSRVDRIDETLVLAGVIKDGDERVAIHVVDVRAGIDLDIVPFPLTLTLNVRNLLQYNYVELLANMAPPRTYVLTIDARI